MVSRFMVMTAAVFGIVLCAGLPIPTRAAYILKASPTCQADFPTATDLIVHEVNGVRTAPQSDTFQWITCSIPRSPNAVLAANGSFYVDGDNLNGASTTCWIASYSYTGDFLGMSSFTTTLAHYDYFLTLPAAQLGPWAYTSLTCALPARGNGLLRGVTTVQ